MTQVRFDFACDTQDGSYLGIYASGLQDPLTLNINVTGVSTTIDMQLDRAKYSIDGSFAQFRDGVAIGYFGYTTDTGELRFPVQRCFISRTNRTTKDRFRIELGPAYKVF